MPTIQGLMFRCHNECDIVCAAPVRKTRTEGGDQRHKETPLSLRQRFLWRLRDFCTE